MAHIRRREPWVDAAELLTDDRACFRRTGDRMLLSYAESWLMVYPPDDRPGPPAAVPQPISRRSVPAGSRRERLEDARAHFGDLVELDRELRQEGIRLQRGR